MQQVTCWIDLHRTVLSLCLNPTGVLLEAINANLAYFYGPIQKSGCKRPVEFYFVLGL